MTLPSLCLNISSPVFLFFFIFLGFGISPDTLFADEPLPVFNPVLELFDFLYKLSDTYGVLSRSINISKSI